jgi:signal transduction histidine kinase
LPVIRGNIQRLEQVFINLIQNACQALPDNRRAIRVSTNCDREMSNIVITVQDEGVGIPTDSLPNIADPFFTTKEDSGGVGLGLSISSRIVEEHGGRMTFTSELEKGTKVEVILPINEAGSTETEMTP